jgi:signal transduction histidine kinase
VVLVDALHTGSPTLLQTLGHVLLVAVPLLAADAHRTRHANVALLRERLELAERTREQEGERRAAQERMRIARDLHDVVAHTLTTINVQAATAAELLDRNPAHAKGALETIEDASREAIGELRGILGVLRNGESGEVPLTPAPGLDDVAELVGRTREEGVDVRIDVAGERPARVLDAVSLAAFRIVQESLTNARRHAAGAPVRVRLGYEPGSLTLAVENEAGASTSRNGATAGVGIIGMTERASALGGTLSAGRLPDGFRVDARLPYARAAE